MANEPKQNSVTIPSWLAATIISFVITGAGWAFGSGGLAQKVNSQEQVNQILFDRVNAAGDLAKKHEAIIPRIEMDMTEIKRDIKQILQAVRN